MRFTYAEAMTDAHFYAPLAQAAEAAGYTSMTVADSLIYPEESDSTYPYTDTGDREFLEGKEFIETMILVTHLAAATSSSPSRSARSPTSATTASVSVSGCLPGRRTSRRWVCRGRSAASGWTSAWTSCAA
jgi:hypothetical protein